MRVNLKRDSSPNREVRQREGKTEPLPEKMVSHEGLN